MAWGFDAESADSGRDAINRLELRLLENRPFSAAVVGVQMKDLGLEDFVRTLQSVPALQTLPVVALYHMGSSVALTGIDASLVTQLPKPLRVSELYNTLQSALTGSKAASVSKPGVDPGKIASKLPVLVVDDNEINRYVAMEQVEQLGLRVETACNGLEPSISSRETSMPPSSWTARCPSWMDIPPRRGSGSGSGARIATR